MRVFPVLLSVLLLLPLPCLAADVTVRLEPLPPLVREDGGGLTVDLLRAVEQVSDLRFAIDVVPYSRAKYQLRNGQADVIGHTPVGFESADFYQYAQDIGWRVPTGAGLFSLVPETLDLSRLGDGYVGTPLGNAEFFAELTGVPVERFVEASLPNLVQMLAHGRIQVLVFESVSTRRAIRDAELAQVHFRHLEAIEAGLAVRRDAAGDALREQLDSAIKRIDTRSLFSAYLADVPPQEDAVVLLP